MFFIIIFNNEYKKINRNATSANAIAILTIDSSSNSLYIESITVSLKFKAFSFACYYSNSTFVFDFSNITTCGEDINKFTFIFQ